MPRLTDHALLRLLERSGFPVEQLRASVERSLAKAHHAAEALGGPDHLIVADGLVFVVRRGDVTTVLPAGSPRQLARYIEQEAGER